MKKQSTNQFSQTRKEQTEILTTVVSETLATGFNQAKTFSTADLWNIQRKRRTMMIRKYYV